MPEHDDEQATLDTSTREKDDERRADDPVASPHAPKGQLDQLSQPRPVALSNESLYVAPPQVELVADGVGRMAKARVPIAVRGPKGTGPSVVATTSPDLFGVISGPNILPTADEVAPHNHFVLRFGAQRAGKFEGSLDIRPQTPGFGDFKLPLVGYTDPSLAPVSAPTKRELAMPPEVDLGEHVVGSDRVYDIMKLAMSEPGSAVVHPISILDTEGAQSRPGDDNPLVLRTNASAAFRRTTNEDMRVTDTVRRTLDIAFAPAHAGRHTALLEVPITWADGIMTKQYVRISGRAREITKPADDTFGQVPAERSPNIAHEELELNGDSEHDFDLMSETNENHAASIAENQNAGVERAAEDAKGYVQRPPEPSVLAPLIETALGMANAGLARVFANAIGSALASEAARTLRDGVAAAAVKESAKRELAAISEPIREGFKNAGKSQIAKIKTSLAPKIAENKPYSGFFEVQQDLLREQMQAARLHMTNTKFRLRPLLKTTPEVALLAQRTAQHGLEAAVAHGKQQQHIASLSKYLVSVASSQARDPEALSDRLAYARDFGADNPHNFTQGMLRLAVDVTEHGMTVESTKLTGVSRVALSRFEEIQLQSVPIPIIVTVRSTAGRGVITRDPNGVIRASGSFPMRKSTIAEANNVEYARELLERLLTRSLKDWKAKIEHDDVGDHREQAP